MAFNKNELIGIWNFSNSAPYRRINNYFRIKFSFLVINFRRATH